MTQEPNSHASFPPPGFVDRYGAAALLGIGTAALSTWVRQGRLGYAGILAMGPNCVRQRIYDVAELEKAREAMPASEEARARLPGGLLDRDGAAAFFGVGTCTLDIWHRHGRLSCGKWITMPSGKRRKVFAVADLEKARERMGADATRPTAPEGFVELHAAARMLAVHPGTLHQWELWGRLKAGRVTPIPGTSARTKIFPVEEIRRLAEEIKEAAANFPPAGWLGMNQAARRAQVGVQLWKQWIAEGRVESGRWVTRPTKTRCKLFSVEEVERIVEEQGRDHLFFMEPDGLGNWRPPAGYVDRHEAAAMFGVAQRTFNTLQSLGRVACGRWARFPAGEGTGEGGGRRVYPVDDLSRLTEEFSKLGQPYPDPDRPGIVRVPIMSWSKTRFEAIIDAADLPLIEGRRWNWMPSSEGFEAVVVQSAPSGEQVPLRRFILGLNGPQWRFGHRNGDPLDCRRANIIVRNYSEQLGHARKRKMTAGRPCTSRFKGVCWIEKSGKWQAQIQKEGAQRRLGSFRNELAAAEAYDEAARELFGEHARLNFPDGIDARLESEAELLAEESGTTNSALDAA